jgi:hypothetical protein
MSQSKAKNIQADVLHEITIKVAQDLLGPRIAIARNRKLFSEDQKRELLTDGNTLMMMLLSPFEVVDRVTEYTKHLDKRSRELDEERMTSSFNGKGDYTDSNPQV